MKSKILIFLTLIGLSAIFYSCEKDGEMVKISTDPVPPALLTVPDLTLERTNANDTLVFEGSVVDPGFTASATYILQACPAGNNFQEVTQLYSGTTVEEIKIAVSDLNSILLEEFPADETSDLDLRIRAVLVVDAGTGAPGTGTNPMEYFSDVVSTTVTIYGLPRLDLIDSGIEQKIQSAKGDGVYTGMVKLEDASAFTLYDPDTETTYGGSNGALAADGTPIDPEASGWHTLTVNVNDLSYELSPYSVGVVGEFTGWGEDPDHAMDYDAEEGHWFITVDIPVGPMKFRLNSNWDVNWGPGSDTDLPADGGTLELPDSNGNINITGAGNYTIHLKLNGSSGSVTFIKNS